MRKLLINTIFILPFLSFSQSGCSYNDNVDYSSICDKIRSNFYSNADADKALSMIVEASGLAKNFALVQCDDINNCYATELDGVRLIIYDGDFMRGVAKKDYAKISILAHEIGHHINGHVVGDRRRDLSLSAMRQAELEADEWSGRIMYLLGYSLDQAQEAIKKTIRQDEDDTLSTHPSRNKRLSAISTGWQSAKNQVERLKNNRNTIVNKNNDEYIPQSMRGNNINNSNSNITDAQDFYRLGNKLLAEEKYELAIKNYTKAINAAGQSDYKKYAYLNRGLCYSNLENYDTAIENYNEAIKIDPQYGLAYNNRAVDKQLAGYNSFCDDYELACQYDYEKACGYYEEDCGELMVSGEEYFYKGYELHSEDPELAITYYSKAINSNYQYKEFAYLNRGLCYSKLENYTFALSDFNKAIEIDPQYGLAYNNRAVTRAILEYDGVCDDFELACQYDYEKACDYYEEENCDKNKTSSNLAECLSGNCQNGYGTYMWLSGNKYAGEWKNGQRNGQGTFTWSSGDKYVGEFKDDKRDGQGTYLWPNGNEYIGAWKNGKRNGRGTLYFASGSTYVGEWKNSKQNGYGTHTWSDGDKYVGQWKDGKRSGYGTYYSNGTSKSGQWDAGEFIGK